MNKMEKMFYETIEQIKRESEKQVNTFNYLLTRKEQNMIDEFKKYALYLTLDNMKG